jgi:hypothetical protein
MDQIVGHVQETPVRSPPKSIHRKRRELQMPQSSIWFILCKHLRMKEEYQLQLLQVLNPQDHNLHFQFCMVSSSG